MDWWAAGGTALVVPVQEAERVVGDLRRLHSQSGRDGMTAHVTLAAPLVPIAPFLPELRTAASRFDPFSFRLATVGRFTSAVYLEPDPAEPFVGLAKTLRAIVPAEPAPDGRIVPHVTIASRVERSVLDEVEATVSALLPLHARATELAVYIRGDDLRLRVHETIPLGR